jgi:hypothetical protein
MKIAVCLSGHYRTYDITHELWKKYIYDKYDCDIFMHTWDTYGVRRGAPFHEFNKYEYLRKTRNDIINSYNVKDLVVERYYPKFSDKFLKQTEHIVTLLDYTGRGPDPGENIMYNQLNEPLAGMYSMFYKRWKVFELMEIYSRLNNVKYDLVIGCRFDHAIDIKLNINELSKDKLYLPCSNKYNIEDRWALGSIELMREYSQIYPRLDYLEKYWNLGNRINGEIHINGLNITDKYIKTMNIPYQTFPCCDAIHEDPTHSQIQTFF